MKSITRDQILKKILLLHVPVLCCLFILTDHETSYSDETDSGFKSKRHLALFTALSRHPPSMRVYRGIIELILLGFCSSLSLYVWEGIVDKKVIAKLMFQLPYTLQKNDFSSNAYKHTESRCVYEMAERADNNIDDDDDDDDDSSGSGSGSSCSSNSNSSSSSNNLHNEKYPSCDKDEITSMEPTEERFMEGEHDEIDCEFDDFVSTTIPSSIFLLDKSLDYLLLTLISLFLFTISSSAGGQYIDQTNKQNNDGEDNNYSAILSQISSITAPIFPLALFLIFTIKLFFPWNQSKYHFWTCISYTLGAPFYDVSFRDGFIGDIFTSMIRPMQDLAYTTFYLFSGLQGWWVYRNDDIHKTTTLEEDIILQPVEHSWLLHTVILPACMVSPLWWRYCQTLRQTYDTKKRWPYLGNAFKYFLAAQVVILGAFFEPKKGHHFSFWIMLYVIATVYQILWDIFMDWELLAWKTTAIETAAAVTSSSKGNGIGDSIGIWKSLELRKNRLYSNKSLYVGILILNIILRFGWMLNFIPSRYLSQTTGVLEYTFSADFSTFVAPFLASAEIIRRTLWGFIRLELEAVKTMEKDESIVRNSVTSTNMVNTTIINGTTESKRGIIIDHGVDDGIEMKPMSISTTVDNSKNMVSFKTLSFFTFQNNSDVGMRDTSNDVQILWEVCAYGTIFMFTGFIAAIHRQVL